MKRILSIIKEIAVLLKISFLELKVNGIITTLLTLVLPLGIMGMVYFVGGFSSPEFGIQMLAGNVTLIISQSCIYFLAGSLLYLKLMGGFEQYAVFPIVRLSVVISNILFRLILMIPYLLILFFVSVYFFKIPLNIHPLFFLVLTLASVTLSSMGTLLAVCSNNYRRAQSLLNILMFGIMFAAPLYYSLKVLPMAFQIFQLCLPFVYIVDAFKQVIAFHGYSFKLGLNILALFLFNVLSITAASFFYKWQAVE